MLCIKATFSSSVATDIRISLWDPPSLLLLSTRRVLLSISTYLYMFVWHEEGFSLDCCIFGITMILFALPIVSQAVVLARKRIT